MSHSFPSVTIGTVNDEDGWVAFEAPPGDLIEGDPRCRIKLFRSSGARTRVHRASLLSLEPSTFRWRFEGDESWVVLRGRLTLVFDDGERLELATGSVASIAAGRSSTWTVHEPFLKFVVNTQG